MDAVFRVRERALEFAQSLADSLSRVRQPVGAENEQDDQHENQDFTATQIPQHGRPLLIQSLRCGPPGPPGSGSW